MYSIFRSRPTISRGCFQISADLLFNREIQTVIFKNVQCSTILVDSTSIIDCLCIRKCPSTPVCSSSFYGLHDIKHFAHFQPRINRALTSLVVDMIQWLIRPGQLTTLESGKPWWAMAQLIPWPRRNQRLARHWISMTHQILAVSARHKVGTRPSPMCHFSPHSSS